MQVLLTEALQHSSFSGRFSQPGSLGADPVTVMQSCCCRWIASLSLCALQFAFSPPSSPGTRITHGHAQGTAPHRHLPTSRCAKVWAEKVSCPQGGERGTSTPQKAAKILTLHTGGARSIDTGTTFFPPNQTHRSISGTAIHRVGGEGGNLISDAAAAKLPRVIVPP